MPAPYRRTLLREGLRALSASLLASGALVLSAAPGPWAPEAAAEGSGSGIPFAGGRLLGTGPDRVSLGLGAYNMADTESPSDDDDDEGVSAQALAEYRLGRKVYGIGPMAGITANSDGAVYGYGGVYLDFAYGDLVFTPSAGFGGYAQGDSKNLGGVFEFHVSFEAAWQLEGGERLGVRFMHLSNAWTHDDNPGVESLLLTYTLPLGL